MTLEELAQQVLEMRMAQCKYKKHPTKTHERVMLHKQGVVDKELEKLLTKQSINADGKPALKQLELFNP